MSEPDEQDRKKAMPGSKTVLLVAALALAAVVAASWRVGHVGSEHGFDWELAGVFGTALGTTLLAITTGLLAWLTWGDVRATQDLATSTREDQAARERPILILHSVYLDGFALEATVINVGLGPALDVKLSAEYVGQHPQPHIVPGTIAAILAGGQDTGDMEIRFHDNPTVSELASNFRVSGTFTDRARRQVYVF